MLNKWEQLEQEAKNFKKKDFSIPELEEKLSELTWLCFKADEIFNFYQEELNIAEDTKKVNFALIKEKTTGKSDAEKERMALTSDEWSRILDVHHELREKRAEAMLWRDKYRRNWETCRSLLSSKRNELKTIGG